MATEDPRSWPVIRRQLPIDEARVAFYRRLRYADQRLDDERKRRGISEQEFDAAQVIDAVTGEEETEDLIRLARSVAALGGRLEVNAVFADKTIQLLIEPEPTSDPA
jgi:hypothetical protein